MKYVLDASVALKWVLPEPDSQQAIALRHAYRHSVHELIAPDVFAVEVALRECHCRFGRARRRSLARGGAC